MTPILFVSGASTRRIQDGRLSQFLFSLSSDLCVSSLLIGPLCPFAIRPFVESLRPRNRPCHGGLVLAWRMPCHTEAGRINRQYCIGFIENQEFVMGHVARVESISVHVSLYRLLVWCSLLVVISDHIQHKVSHRDRQSSGASFGARLSLSRLIAFCTAKGA